MKAPKSKAECKPPGTPNATVGMSDPPSLELFAAELFAAPADDERLGDPIFRVDVNYLPVKEHRIRCRRSYVNCIVRH
jgi:hypothetical protein